MFKNYKAFQKLILANKSSNGKILALDLPLNFKLDTGEIVDLPNTLYVGYSQSIANKYKKDREILIDKEVKLVETPSLAYAHDTKGGRQYADLDRGNQEVNLDLEDIHRDRAI